MTSPIVPTSEEKRERCRLAQARSRARHLGASRARDRLAAQQRRAKNPEDSRAIQRKFYAKHRQRLNAKSRASYQDNKEKRSRYNRTYYLTHKEEQAARHARWRQANPDASRAIGQRRRARVANAPINDFTRHEWQALKAHYKDRCAYCGRKMTRLTMDHITPLSKGGSHTLANIVPACKSCNSRKRERAPLVPVQPLLLVG